jgi:two-component system sensor histidine kinase HydH
MGAALLVTAWIGRQRTAAAADTLNRGQGEFLLESVRQDLRGAPLPLDASRFDSLLERHRSAGLRYVGVIDTAGRAVAQAGEAAGPLPGEGPQPAPAATTGPREPPPTLTVVGDRLRMYGMIRLGLPGPPPGSEPERPPAPRVRSRPPILIIEFEPVVAQRLAAEATRTFVLSALVAAALLAASLVFWRLSIRQETIERRLEQQRRLGVLGEMSAVLAHEIRNPLASLKGNAQLLAERLDAESPERRKAELVVQEAQRLEALTGDLLDFARSGPIAIAPADPAALLRASADEVIHDGFVVHAEGAPPAWPLDADRMRQALTNVLRNARQVSPAGTRPEAAVARVADALVFTVRDFGPGVPAGEEKRIFSPFYTTRTQGTGLGLAVALRVAELHDRTITVSNHPDGGAVFRIVVPGG